jgi:hypothetical protein
MKRLSCIALLGMCIGAAWPAITAEPAYDAALATKLKADDIGMRMYVMALLKAGPNRNRPEKRALQAAAHGEHQSRRPTAS